MGDCRQAALAEGLVASSEIPKSPRFGATGIRPFFLGGDQIDRVTRHKLYSIASSVLLAASDPGHPGWHGLASAVDRQLPAREPLL